MTSQADDLLKIETELVQLEKDASKLVSEKKQLEAQLAGFNARVKGNHYLRNDEYRKICNRQSNIKTRLAQIESEYQPLKSHIRELHVKSTYIRMKSNQPSLQKEVAGDVPITHDVIEHITRLRDEWLDFAGDKTRVSSMRAMAAQFASELTKLLTLINS